MKVLIICSKNSGWIVPFISEQANSITSLGVEVDWFCIEQKGIIGYLKMIPKFLKKCKSSQPDLIHAHYGLCGLVANMQRKTPVVTTYPGSDINTLYVRFFSILSIWLSKYNIFMCTRQFNIVKCFVGKNRIIMTYGIDLSKFIATDKQQARNLLGFKEDEKLVLFASRFDRPVKNPQLAFDALTKLPEARLLELTGKYSKEEMIMLMHAVDVALMTSHTEGSPQFIKEVMICGCPIVSVDVGDVKEITSGIDGCYIAERSPEDIAEKLKLALNFNGKTQGRQHIIELGLDNKQIAQKLVNIYTEITCNN